MTEASQDRGVIIALFERLEKQVAQPPLVAGSDDVGKVCAFVCTLSAPPTAGYSQYLQPCSDSIARGAGCPNGASPDL
jgi:hypothetical protein